MSRVKPAFGPALPALLRRHGLPPVVTLLAVFALIALLGFAMVVVRPGPDPDEQLVHRDGPVFNLLYEEDRLSPVEPRPGELVRLEGGRGRRAASVVVRRLELPPYRGDVAHGLLPVVASAHIDRLRETIPRFRLELEGRARVNDAPGYEVAFRSGRLRGNDVLLVPAEEEARGAVLVSLRRAGDGEVARAARQAYLSFAYGTDPA